MFRKIYPFLLFLIMLIPSWLMLGRDLPALMGLLKNHREIPARVTEIRTRENEDTLFISMDYSYSYKNREYGSTVNFQKNKDKSVFSMLDLIPYYEGEKIRLLLDARKQFSYPKSLIKKQINRSIKNVLLGAGGAVLLLLFFTEPFLRKKKKEDGPVLPMLYRQHHDGWLEEICSVTTGNIQDRMKQHFPMNSLGVDGFLCFGISNAEDFAELSWTGACFQLRIRVHGQESIGELEEGDNPIKALASALPL